jgi:DNA (cytosine-5)-methyltransferase 1
MIGEKLNELALFAGAGGGILGGKLLGWETVCAVEIESYAASVLLARQNDGILSPFPIWDDICTFDGNPWRGIVDVISGGFPCQDISVAGKGQGIDSERSGLWKEMLRIICEVRPRYIFAENSAALTVRGGTTVMCDLASVGYNAKWGTFRGGYAGAPHRRERMFILATDTAKVRWIRTTNEVKSRTPCKSKIWSESSFYALLDSEKLQYAVKSKDQRMGDGIPDGMDRFAAIGNAQIPAVAELAWETLYGGIMT